MGLFAAMQLLAQPGAFSQFAATGDGQQLFFISPLALAGSQPVPSPFLPDTGTFYSNLYRMEPGRHPVAIEQRVRAFGFRRRERGRVHRS